MGVIRARAQFAHGRYTACLIKIVFLSYVYGRIHTDALTMVFDFLESEDTECSFYID